MSTTTITITSTVNADCKKTNSECPRIPANIVRCHRCGTRFDASGSDALSCSALRAVMTKAGWHSVRLSLAHVVHGDEIMACPACASRFRAVIARLVAALFNLGSDDHGHGPHGLPA